MRAQDPPPVSGRPDDKKLEEWLRENRELEEKYGAALNLFEAQLTLFAELIRPEAALLLSPEPLGLARDIVWIDHLSEIAGMRLSPLSMIYEIWSRAPAFSKGKLGTYRNRDNLGIPFRYHKIASKGTPREILFKSISIASLDNPAKALDGIRKAGYSHALKEKYRPIIDLIYRLSFLGNEKKRLPLRVAAPFLGAAILPR
jgi:hypothetical protein